MTGRPLGQAIDEAERALTEAGVWAPRSDAEMLTAHVLGLEPVELAPETPVDDATLAALEKLVAQRAARIPLGYITGSAVLGGVRVSVGSGVFVPRVHTEPLLAWGLSVLREIANPVVVDLCTGSGALALAVAHARPDAVVHAVELSSTALEYARHNANQQAELGDTPIRLIRGDVTDAALYSELDGTADLVLANPPFVPDGTEMLPEWSEHHPSMSLYSGADGLFVIRHVVALAARLLRPGGHAGIEHDDPQVEPIAALLRATGVFAGITDNSDHHGRPRYTTAHRIQKEGQAAGQEEGLE